jgi:SAM-dependent methyltransferase
VFWNQDFEGVFSFGACCNIRDEIQICHPDTMVWLLIGANPEGILNALKQAIPKPAKKLIRNLYLGVLDLADASTRRVDMIPPRRMHFVGNGEYKAVGLEFKDLFIRRGGLRPEHRVLDVGCGQGRMAAPLTGYLTGEYEGFDIVESGVKWCQKNITSRYPRFQFRHSDVKNASYNPGGKFEASSYRFPYEDGSFDFVFLTSVFTHMFPDDMNNYLKEISRVMKTGGSCFITMFLLNGESQTLIDSKQSTTDFSHVLEGCVTSNPEHPEDALAFDEGVVRREFTRHRLNIVDPIHFGSWCGREKFVSYQDIVVAKKV